MEKFSIDDRVEIYINKKAEYAERKRREQEEAKNTQELLLKREAEEAERKKQEAEQLEQNRQQRFRHDRDEAMNEIRIQERVLKKPGLKPGMVLEFY